MLSNRLRASCARLGAISLGLACLLAGCQPYVPATPLPDAMSMQVRTHYVVQGETLENIARKYNIRLSQLRRYNRLGKTEQLEIGQPLLIPKLPSPVEVEVPRLSLQEPKAVPVPAVPVVAVAETEYIWPVQGKVVSLFGTEYEGFKNKGIDIAAPAGSLVLATKAGAVKFVHQDLPGFGKTVFLEHQDGMVSVYAYLQGIDVRPGDQVQQSDVVGTVGTTGRSEVPALHFEIRRQQAPENPMRYLP